MGCIYGKKAVGNCWKNGKGISVAFYSLKMCREMGCSGWTDTWEMVRNILAGFFVYKDGEMLLM